MIENIYNLLIYLTKISAGLIFFSFLMNQGQLILDADAVNKLINNILLFNEKNDIEKTDADEVKNNDVKKEIKYEEKYLDKYNLFDSTQDVINVIFTNEEIQEEELLEKKLRNDYINEQNSLIEKYIEKTDSLTEILENEDILQDYLDNKNVENGIDVDKIKNKDEFKRLENDELLVTKETLKEELEYHINEIFVIKTNMKELLNNVEHFKKIAHETIIEKRLDTLKNNIIIEKTPLGNVLMFWDNSRKSFTYYSDNTIPYRFLETVGRKYVITYKCKSIYVDMETIIKEAEIKLEEEKRLLKEKEEREKEEKEKEKLLSANPFYSKQTSTSSSDKLTSETDKKDEKKNVFAKFKSYNKNNTKTASSVAPPKNNINSNQTNTNTSKQNEKVLLKEKSNRYTHEGRLMNYNIIKKVDKKKTDKRLQMSFSDFKKMHLQNTK
jgi:hypothetical protein